MGKQDVGDLEEIRKGVEVWMQARLPDRPGLRVGPLEFPASSGESSITLLLAVNWPDGAEERFALRMVPPKSQVFEEHDLPLQVKMMDIMRSEGIPVPPVLGYEADPSIVGSDFYVMRFVEGRVPPDNPPMTIAGWVKEDCTPEQRAALWRSGLETLAAIHRIDASKHDLSRLPCASEGEPLVAQELRKFDSMFSQDLRDSCEPEILEAWQWLMANPPQDGTRRICWGDSRPGNVIFREDRPVAVIDWEMANYADPRSDVSWWVWIDRCNSLGLGLDRLPGIPTPEEIYAQWSKESGLSVEGIEWFELFTVARYAIVLALKFKAFAESQPDPPPKVENFAARFLPELLEAAGAR